jgi:hypothetical protein
MVTVPVTKDDNLGKFICRPVNIYTTTVPIGSGFAISILPWSLWYSNADIAQKLSGYARFRGNLKLTLICASTPFNFGFLRASYKPLVNDVSDNSFGDFSGGSGALTDTALNNIIITQRMGVDIHVGRDQTKDLVLPFILPSDFLDMVGAAATTNNFEYMGRLYVTSIAPVQTVSTSTTPVTFSIIAEMQDVVLETPVYNTNAKDEYEEAPVSTVATAVADVGQVASQFAPPQLKPFAVATTMAAKMVAAVAKSLGYTAPIVVEPTMPVRPRHMGNEANTFVPENYEPLSVDPKHGVSVSAMDVGGSGVDELSMDHFCARETLWFTFNWNDTATAGTRLARFAVTPDMGAYAVKPFSVAGTYKAIQLLPCGYASQLFRHWRGTICYRIKVISSPYHQGTLRFYYDPGSTNTTNAVKQRNVLVNVKESPEIVIRVPYSQCTPKLSTVSGNIGDYSTDPWYDAFGGTIFYNPARHNGSLMVDVVEALTAPISGTGVVVCVYAWAEDMQFSSPTLPDVFDDPMSTTTTDVLSHIDPYVLNSKEEVDMGEGTLVEPTTVGGEVISSLRALFGRTCFVDMRSYFSNTAQAGTLRWSRVLYRYPLAPGRATPISGGLNYPTIWDGPGTNKLPYNYVKFNFITWLTPCFVGWRGSIRWRLAAATSLDPNRGGVLSISRYNRVYNPGDDAVLDVEKCKMYTNALTQSVSNFYATQFSDTSGMGTACGHLDVEPVVSAKVPHYSRYAMHPAGAYALCEPGYIQPGGRQPSNDASTDCIKFAASVSGYADNLRPVMFETHVSAGEDFSPLVFVNTPTVFLYTNEKPSTGSGASNAITTVTT